MPSTSTPTPTQKRTAARALRVLMVLALGGVVFLGLEATRREPRVTESAGGSARAASTSASEAGPGASPLSPEVPSGSPETKSPSALAVPSSSGRSPETHPFESPQNGATAGAGPTIGSARSPFRSPLEQSPGYYPPDDPESMSVVTGRREAPAVDGEFTGGASSLEQVFRQALDALERSDLQGLHALRVTKSEFERFIWRELPESRPITNITAEDAWEFTSHSCLAGANRALGDYAGRALEVVDAKYAGPIAYRNFTIYREVTLLVRDRATGERLTLDFLPVVAERHGRFKVYSYQD